MRIKKIELENHPILGNLKLDFTDGNGECVDTVIFAGENGTGKTSVLDLLFDFSIFNLENEKRDEKRIYELVFSEQELNIIKLNQNHQHFFKEGLEGGVFKFLFDYNIIGNWNQIKIEFLDKKGDIQTTIGNLFHEQDIKALIRAIYSDVEINYTPNEIRSVTAKDVDEKRSTSYKSGNNLATEITQLLIDIQSLDSQEFSQWGKLNLGKPVDESKIDTRIKRFTKAFDLIFPNKKFIGIENRNGHKEVLFQENNKIMNISQLSSGEKQIVFRGGFLLKDKESSKGAIVLIDEPEISMHPTWQIEILDFYKTLFVNSEQVLSSQLFVATHSPFIIHNPNRTNDKVIILTKKKDGNITTLTSPEFYSWTKSRIVKEAFRINYDLSNTKGKLFLEGETDEKYFRKTKEVFNLNNLEYDISWIGRINENGNTEFTGDTALNQAKSFFLANSDLIQSKVVLYYDSDTNKSEEQFGNLLIKKMPKNEINLLFEIGIENLLSLPNDFDKANFYTEKVRKDKYGAESIIRSLDKTKLCNWICDDCDLGKQKEILKNIKPLLIEINE